jgi:hypothetical protein
MELTQVFTFMVLGICAAHLVWMASAQITHWLDVRKASRPQNAATNQKPVQQRSDWYAFFSCSALVGSDQVKKGAVSIKENKTQKALENPHPQKRPRAQL